jgi:glycosyltransferase involved in cell wall biosynthesis
MKIVILVDDMDTSKGYMEYHLALELTKLGQNVHILSFHKEKGIVKHQSAEGFQITRLPYFWRFGNYHIPTLLAIRFAIRYIRRLKPDVIHCQPLFSPLSAVLVSLKNVFRFRVVGSVISGGKIAATGQLYDESLSSKIRYIAIKGAIDLFLSKRTDRIFAISEGIKKLQCIHFSLDSEKHCRIPLGSNPDLFRRDQTQRSATRERLNIPKKAVVVINTGSSRPTKKLDFLVKALAPIIHRNKEVIFLQIGAERNSQTQTLKNLCRELGISESVIFQEQVHRLNLPEFYSASDIAVWPGEPSISIVDAASSSLPLVIRRSLFTDYLVTRGNGFSFAPDNVVELSNCIKELVEDVMLRKRMGNESRRLVETWLNWERLALQYLSCYRSALREIS